MFLLITIVAKRAGRVPVGFSDSAASSGSLCAAHALQGIARTRTHAHIHACARTHARNHAQTSMIILLHQVASYAPPTLSKVLHAHAYTHTHTHAHPRMYAHAIKYIHTNKHCYYFIASSGLPPCAAHSPYVC